MTIDELDDLRSRALSGTSFHADFRTWDRDYPKPVHPTLGPHKCPDVVIWERIGEPEPDLPEGEEYRTALVYSQIAAVPPGAAWESPTYWENKKTLALGCYIAELLNRGHRDE